MLLTELKVVPDRDSSRKDFCFSLLIVAAWHRDTLTIEGHNCQFNLRGYSVILGGLRACVYIFYIYVNNYRVPHFELSLRGYSVILRGGGGGGG